jgi:hypothetical protein
MGGNRRHGRHPFVVCLFCWLVDERVESEVKVRQRQTKKALSQAITSSLSNPLHAIAFQGLFARLRREIC